MLVIKNLSVSAQDKIILNNISFFLAPKNSLAIMGPSGSGKSTLVKAILGLLDLKILGEIKFCDQKEIKNIAYIPQDLALWPHLNIEDTLILSKRFSQSPLEPHEILKICGLLEKKKSFLKNLSGGEKQRLALARALIQKPKLLILDEPFSNLDLVAIRTLIEVIKKLRELFGFSLILISHNLEECLRLSNEIMILYEKKTFWHGLSLNLNKNSFPKSWNPLENPLANLRFA
jgi:iron(III) transport system ATP-binding protein